VRLRPDLPLALEEILNKALEKDCDLRYQHAADMRADLKRLKRDTDSGRSSGRVSTQHPAVSGEATAASAAARKFSLKAAWWVPVAAVVLLGLVYFLRPELPPPKVSGIKALTQDGAFKLFPNGYSSPIQVTDGSRIYFMEVTSHIRLKQVSTKGGETVPVEAPPEFSWINDISPLHLELLIAGAVRGTANSDVWVLPVPGGQPRRIGNLVALSAAWSQDGTSLYFNSEQNLFVAKSDGSQPQKLLTTNGIPYWIRPSPDGRFLRFSVLDPKFNTYSLMGCEVRRHSTKAVVSGSGQPDERLLRELDGGREVLYLPIHSGWCSEPVGDA